MFFKNLLKSLLISLVSMLVLTLLVTLINYIGLINVTIVKVVSYMIPVISLFIGGVQLGKKSISKGWLEGIKLGLLFILLIFIFNFLAFSSIQAKHLIVYALILLGSILGGMVGISQKKIEQ